MRPMKAPTAQLNFAPGGNRPVVREPERHLAFDAEIAKLFTDLRRHLGWSVPQIAHHIATHPNTIAALESGRIDLLPGWSETARVVTAYIGLARLDPRPALERLSVITGAAHNRPEQRSRHVPSAGSIEAAAPVARIFGRFAQAAARAREQAAETGILTEWALHLKETVNGLGRSVVATRAPVRWVVAGALALTVIGSAAPSGVLQASVSGISQPISGFWRKISGRGGDVRIIIRNGLKWIEADDPRERRSDKLPFRRS